MTNFPIVFDKVMLKQFKKEGKNKFIQDILSRIFNKIEELGPKAGKLLDSKLHIYEIKLKRLQSDYITNIILKQTKFMYLNIK